MDVLLFTLMGLRGPVVKKVKVEYSQVHLAVQYNTLACPHLS